VLALAAAAERPSEHPLAAAVVRAARERGLPIADATGFGSVPGRGVRATVAGTAVVVGSPAVLDGVLENVFEKRGAGRPGQTGPAGSPASAAHIRAARTHSDVAELEAGGATVVAVLADGRPA